MTDERLAEAAAFIGQLFGDLPDGLKVLVWTLQGRGANPAKVSHWCDNPAQAVEAVRACGDDVHVYVSMGLSPKAYGPHRRCKQDDVAGLVGFWADVDVAGPTHPKVTFPATADQARELVAKFPLPPTILVDSGTGLHAYWLFREPWTFADADERTRAKATVGRFAAALEVHAAAGGGTLRGTFNLDRVMRVPGTFNVKAELAAPAACRILELDADRRYSVDDFEPFLPPAAADDAPAAAAEASPAEARPAPVTATTLKVNAKAEPPVEKFARLASNEPLFLASWDRKREFLDQSLSTYDNSLASFAAGAGWDDQEIVDLLVAFRRKHGAEPKRLDYYSKHTIARVRAGRSARANTAPELAGVAPPAPPPPPGDGERGRGGPGDDELGQARESLQNLLGVPILELVKRTGDPASYSLTLDGHAGEVYLGGAEAVMSLDAFRKAIYDATRRIVPNVKRTKWLEVVKLLTDLTREIVQTDAGRMAQTRHWVTSYLSSSPITYADENWAEALKDSQPFRRQGQVFVHADRFRSYLLRSMDERVTSKQVRDRLSELGFKGRAVCSRKNAEPVNRFYHFIAEERLKVKDSDEPGEPGEESNAN